MKKIREDTNHIKIYEPLNIELLLRDSTDITFPDDNRPDWKIISDCRMVNQTAMMSSVSNSFASSADGIVTGVSHAQQTEYSSKLFTRDATKHSCDSHCCKVVSVRLQTVVVPVMSISFPTVSPSLFADIAIVGVIVVIPIIGSS